MEGVETGFGEQGRSAGDTLLLAGLSGTGGLAKGFVVGLSGLRGTLNGAGRRIWGFVKVTVAGGHPAPPNAGCRQWHSPGTGGSWVAELAPSRGDTQCCTWSTLHGRDKGVPCTLLMGALHHTEHQRQSPLPASRGQVLIWGGTQAQVRHRDTRTPIRTHTQAKDECQDTHEEDMCHCPHAHQGTRRAQSPPRQHPHGHTHTRGVLPS